MTRLPCAHCAVLTLERDLHRGYCVECHASEAPDLPPAERDGIELSAVRTCRRAGLSAITRPCIDDRCGSCLPEQKVPHRGAPEDFRYAGPSRWSDEFTDQDAIDLDKYFRVDISPSWEQSTFGAMCDRIAEEVNKHTEERPTDLTPRCPQVLDTGKEDCPHRVCGMKWLDGRIEIVKRKGKTGVIGRELQFVRSHRHSKPRVPARVYETEVAGKLVQVEVYPSALPPAWMDAKGRYHPEDGEVHASHTVRPMSGSGEGGAAYDEGDLVSYFDQRYRMKAVFRALSCLSKKHQAALEARYSPAIDLRDEGGRKGWALPADAEVMERVWLLTATLEAERERRARAGKAESVRDAFVTFVQAVNSTTVSAEERKHATDMLNAIKREAREMLQSAEKAYAVAAMENVRGQA